MASHKSLDGSFTGGHKRLNGLMAVRKGMHDVVVRLAMEETLRLAWSAKQVLPDGPCWNSTKGTMPNCSPCPFILQKFFVSLLPKVRHSAEHLSTCIPRSLPVACTLWFSIHQIRAKELFCIRARPCTRHRSLRSLICQDQKETTSPTTGSYKSIHMYMVSHEMQDIRKATSCHRKIGSPW